MENVETTERTNIETEAVGPPEPASGIEQIPAFRRFPKNGTLEASKNMIYRIDAKIARLATLGLRPHPIMLGYRQELLEQLKSGGPYKLRLSSAFF